MNAASGHYLILGSGSAIAAALARELAAAGKPLILAGRKLDAVNAQATDLRLRYGVPVEVIEFDALEPEKIPSFVERCCQIADSRIEAVIACYGTMPALVPPDQMNDQIGELVQVNFTSVAQLFECFAPRLMAVKSGMLVAISSVAGDRGRQSNYLYGAAKAALTAYLAGLRNRLYSHGVHVLTVKPGFTDSPMTRGKVPAESPLLASPETVARDIVRAINRRSNVIYTPWWWRGIMAIITSIPESIFKRMKL